MVKRWKDAFCMSSDSHAGGKGGGSVTFGLDGTLDDRLGELGALRREVALHVDDADRAREERGDDAGEARVLGGEKGGVREADEADQLGGRRRLPP